MRQRPASASCRLGTSLSRTVYASDQVLAARSGDSCDARDFRDVRAADRRAAAASPRPYGAVSRIGSPQP